MYCRKAKIAKFVGSSEKAQKRTLRLLKMALYKLGGGGGGGGGGLAKKTLCILPSPLCPEAPSAAVP